jgi:glutamyl-tRNA reductase|tara:strand:+ start:1460 stop:2704 length:1245 start_codon:yes stop_codon:yes gene_type:complete
MDLNIIGLNHKTTPLSLREKFVFHSDQISHALLDLKGKKVSQVAILSTCNRTEIYFNGPKIQIVYQWLADYHHIKLSQLKKHLYHYNNKDALTHAYRVASGLDSMFLGETQILGQMKQAAKISDYAGTRGKFLSHFFQTVFEAAKEIRSKTNIGASNTTIASTIISLTKKIFGDLYQAKIIFVGAGEITELIAKYFNKHQPKKITIANRSILRAKNLAKKIGAETCLLGEISDQIHEYDVVISCTGSQLPVIGLGMIERAIKIRKHKPMVLVDLAIPRDIESEISKLNDIFLYTLDELAQITQEGIDNRADAVKDAQIIIEKKVNNFYQKSNEKKASPTIISLRNQFEESRLKEIDKAKKQLKNGKSIDEILESLSNNLSNKFLHHPTKALNESAANETKEISELLKKIYSLKE